MFVGPVDLGNHTMLELVIFPLQGSVMPGQWEAGTDLLMLWVVQNSRCCTCRPSDDPSRFTEKLALGRSDAEHLSKWLKANSAMLTAK